MRTTRNKPKRTLKQKLTRRVEGYLIHHINSMKPARQRRALASIYHD